MPLEDVDPARSRETPALAVHRIPGSPQGLLGAYARLLIKVSALSLISGRRS